MANHLTHPDRPATLLGVLTLAIVWAWQMTEQRQDDQPPSPS